MGLNEKLLLESFFDSESNVFLIDKMRFLLEKVGVLQNTLKPLIFQGGFWWTFCQR